MRKVIPMNTKWRFHKGDILVDRPADKASPTLASVPWSLVLRKAFCSTAKRPSSRVRAAHIRKFDKQRIITANVTLPQRKMYMGKIGAAVKPAQGQTSLTLTAIGDTCGCTYIRVDLQQIAKGV